MTEGYFEKKFKHLTLKRRHMKLNGKDIFVLGVPEDAHDFDIIGCLYKKSHQMLWFNNKDGHDASCEKQLPEGQWSILGRAKDIGEEQARGLVLIEEFGNNGYKDFCNANIYFTTAIESFQSWLRVEGIKETDLLLIKNS